MNTTDDLPVDCGGAAAEDDPRDNALAEALHLAQERAARGQPVRVDDVLPPGSDEGGAERLAGALRVADLLTQLVRHVEEEAGIHFPAAGATQKTSEAGHPALPQPFPG